MSCSGQVYNDMTCLKQVQVKADRLSAHVPASLSLMIHRTEKQYWSILCRQDSSRELYILCWFCHHEIYTFSNSTWYFFPHWFWSSHNSLNNRTVKILAISLTNEFRKHLDPSSIWGWPFKLIYHRLRVITSH